MKLKKACAMLSALGLSAGMLSYFPAFDISLTTNAAIVSDDFEVNYDGWITCGDKTVLTADNSVSHNSKRGMSVSGRQNVDDGAVSQKGLYLEGGKTYDYSVYVYHDGDTAENFRLSISYNLAGNNQTETMNIDSKSVVSGEWKQLDGKVKAPKNAENITVKLTTDSTSDFYFDDFTVTGKIKKSANSAYAADAGLKDRYSKYFRVGSVLNGGTVQQSTITANILKEFNSITFENEMKPDYIMDKNNSSGTNVAVSLNACASLLNFCAENNIGVRGHTLVWHGQMPKWFFKENFDENANWVSSTVMDQRMESYIKNMFETIQQQYPSLDLYAYDVCNECISDDYNRTANFGGSREPGWGDGKSPWVQIYGDNKFVEKAFTYAKRYAPSSCSLFYNDYNEYWDHKRDAIYNMCKPLYEKGVLDGIGMQSHIGSEIEGFSGVANYTAALEKYASIGCQVQITELDISTDNGAYTADQQAEKYKAIFQAAVNVNKNSSIPGNVTAVCVWGPNDANTWIGSENTPLLFDANNQPKAAYYAVANLLSESEWGNGAPNTKPGEELKPNDFGWYFNNGFEGSTDGWTGRGGAEVASSSQTAYVGDSSLYVSDRTASWNGAQKSLSTATFKPDTEYSFSANVKYTSGKATDTFFMKLQYTDANGDTQYSTIAESTAVKGEWVQLANMNYKIPSDASNMYLYIETADSTNSFYLDETIVAVGGTGILGAGSQKIILGDVNSDGIVNSFDLVLARKGSLNGFDSTAAQMAADVDQSGVFDETDLTLLQDFILAKITKFPVAEPVIPPVDNAAMEQLFASVKPSVSYKSLDENNPLYTQRFGADPGVMEYNGRVYVYTTNDAFEYDSNGNLKENSYDVQTINCISSADLVNWTDHGAIPAAGSNGAAKWAWASWAPAPAHKKINGKEKFFLYFANSAGGIGVLTSDSPTGPWTDPIGGPIVSGSSPNCSDVIWMFDPAVLVDDDGSAYLYFGGGVPENNPANPKTSRVVKLSDDMIHIDGVPQTIDAPYIFEDSGINKINGKYYYSYCTNWNTGGNPYGFNNAEIAYMVSDSPMGPFTYSGIVMENPGALGGGGNNHHFMCTLNGKLYMFYHARSVEDKMGIHLNYRSPMVNEVNVSADGSIKVKPTMAGVPQTKTLNPYEKIQAETIYRQGGINVRNLGDTIVTDIQKGDWFSVAGANFSNGASSVTVNVSSNKGGAIKICTGDENGKAVGYVEVPAGTSFTEITAPVSGLSGTQDIYFIFSDEMEIDYWYFS